jgi:hypothetical protein
MAHEQFDCLCGPWFAHKTSLSSSREIVAAVIPGLLIGAPENHRVYQYQEIGYSRK